MSDLTDIAPQAGRDRPAVGHPGDPGHEAPPTAGTRVDEALGGAPDQQEDSGEAQAPGGPST
jgi:hypothetical protein